MSIVKINNKDYIVPELGFAHSKKLEQCGVPLPRMTDPNIMFTIIGAFVAIVVGGQDEADRLIEQHVYGGGSLEDIYEAYIIAIEDSGFFKKLLKIEEKPKTKTTKANS